MHALIIKDEPLIAMAIEDALSACGYTSFEIAASFERAVHAARLHCPDLISADVRLSPGCGIDAVEAICRDRPIPVIFITGTVDDLELRRPGSFIVHKPFKIGDIKRAVEQVTLCDALPPASTLPLDTQYYRKRAEAERIRAGSSLGEEVAAIHTVLAEQYEALASQPELRSDFRIKWSEERPGAEQSAPAWTG